MPTDKQAELSVDVDWYHEDCVVGGPGSFVVTINGRDKLKEAIRTKLLLEVVGRTPRRRVFPVAEKQPRIDREVGEKLWQQRWDARAWCLERSIPDSPD